MSTRGPRIIIWDTTYACPLRCEHCYSESGRRPSRQLKLAEMLRVAEAMISLRPELVAFSGGEPLLIPGVLDVAERFNQAGIGLSLYTSGWTLDASMVRDIVRLFGEVHVSVDGATPQTHDRIRGRRGSHERAMRALTLIDAFGADEKAAPFKFGIDCVVVRSNFDEMGRFCTALAPQFRNMAFIIFCACIPVGLASHPSYGAELLSDEQMALLEDHDHRRSLASLAPPGVEVAATSARQLQMHPDRAERDSRVDGVMLVEPDGEVRGMAIYEGTVGSLLKEPAGLLWQRVVERPDDPFVVQTLGAVRTMSQWAEATRRIDQHYGSDATRKRIARRQEPLRTRNLTL